MDRFAFSHFGVSALERPHSIETYRQWIRDGHHGEMEYLAEHLEIKEDPRRWSPRANGAIVVAKPYYPHPYGEPAMPGLRTSLYAQGDDYHVHFANELEDLAIALRADFPDEEFLCFTDSAPILERDLAYRAGLGWVGKNTCLIHPEHGSLFFLGQIFTTLELASARPPIADFCGQCDRCIRACPTGAIEEPRKLNATKCISYWNIEARGAAPEKLRARFGDWFFGCDICQTVCPWNEKTHGREVLRELTKPKGADVEQLRAILNESNRGVGRMSKATPLRRARGRGLKRNALYVIGNLRLRELKNEVEAQLSHPDLNEIARWALAQLT